MTKELAGLTENNLYVAQSAFRNGAYWYIYADDDNGRSGSVMAVEELPVEHDTLIGVSHRTRFRIAVDYDPAKVVVTA